MLEEEVGVVFSPIAELFDKLKKLIFIEQGIREETRLHFIVTNKTDNHNGVYIYEICGEKCSGQLWKPPEDSEKKEVIYPDWIDYKFKPKTFVRKRLGFFLLRGREIEVWCICVSPCLKYNEGKLLLERLFSVFINYVQNWCREVQERNKAPDSEFVPVKIENMDEFAVRILERAADETCEEIECLYFPLVLSTIVGLSGEYYEKSECESNLVFLPWMNKKIDSKDLVYDFRNSEEEESNILFISENIRWIRKLLEMARDKFGLSLILQTGKEEKVYKVVGICSEKKISALLGENESVPWLRIKMKKHMYFSLYLGSTYIFTYQNGNYKIAAELKEADLEERCKKVFGEEGSYAQVAKSIGICRKQSHGTMLIVLKAEDAKEQVERLSKGKYGMKNAVPSVRHDYLCALNSIDGGIIMDTEGHIHGIGMIVDGKAVAEGSMARGARFNSSVKYIEYLREQGIPGMVLIVSEDESVEIMDSV